MVDTNHADDLIARYAYNVNDLRIVIQKPQGNREFTVYDERLLPFRTFYGVAPGAQVTSGYPASKQATSLGATSFVGYRQQNYDSRGNLIQTQDGRGYLAHNFFDFNNRSIARSDPNGNGMTTAYDAAGNGLTTQAGVVSQVTGAITQVLSRTYRRYDEAGRGYQTINDGDLSTDESALVDPATPSNPSRLTFFDPGSRTAQTFDANGNPTTFSYDAAGRRLSVVGCAREFRHQHVRRGWERRCAHGGRGPRSGRRRRSAGFSHDLRFRREQPADRSSYPRLERNQH